MALSLGSDECSFNRNRGAATAPTCSICSDIPPASWKGRLTSIWFVRQNSKLVFCVCCCITEVGESWLRP
jgi:hypothetical protein